MSESEQLKQHLERGLTVDELKTLPDVFKQIDTAATTLITTSGGLVLFYSGSFVIAKVIAANLLYAFLYTLPVALLLGAIISGVWALYTQGYAEKNFDELLRTKEHRLSFSRKFFYAAIGLLAIALFLYLMRPI